jgi:hypothetical protein
MPGGNCWQGHGHRTSAYCSTRFDSALESTIRALLDMTVLRWAILVVVGSGMLLWLTGGDRARSAAGIAPPWRATAPGRQLSTPIDRQRACCWPGAIWAAPESRGRLLLLLLWLIRGPSTRVRHPDDAGPGVGRDQATDQPGLAAAGFATHLPAEQQQPALYRQLFWTLIGGGGMLVTLVVLAHLSDLPAIVVNRLRPSVHALLVLGLPARCYASAGWSWICSARLHGERFWFMVLRFGSLSVAAVAAGRRRAGICWVICNWPGWSPAICLIFIAVQVGWLLSAQPAERSSGGAKKLRRDSFRLRFAMDSGHHHPPAPDSESAAVPRCVGRAVPRLRLDRSNPRCSPPSGLSWNDRCSTVGRGGNHLLGHHLITRHHPVGGHLVGAMEPGDQLSLGAISTSAIWECATVYRSSPNTPWS